MAYYRPEFAEVYLLSEEECRRVEKVVFSLKPFWTQRSPLAPFYTLGVASYLDGNQKERYLELVKMINPILKEHFSWLYEKLKTKLEEVLKAPICFDDQFALPGFHIFLAHAAFLLPVATVHYDLQFEHIDWAKNYPGIDFSTQLSMTLALRLPKAGGGLNLWDVEYEKYQKMSKEEYSDYLTTHPPSFHPYHLGNLVLHSGYRLHQIAPAKSLDSDDVRLTLQAHALYYKDHWVVYW